MVTTAPILDLTREGAPVSATQRVYHALRQSILTGDLTPGERLKVDRLKTMLDVGASPIREALSLLTSDQLVERLDQRGFRVATVSRAQFQEILGLRCSLEDMAMRQSIAATTEAWEEAVVLAHHRLTRAPRGDIEFETVHKAFHMALLSNCASPILLNFCSQLYDLNIRYRYLAGKSGSYNRRDVTGEHADILQAALDRKPDIAAELLTEHYRKTGDFLAEQFVDF